MSPAPMRRMNFDAIAASAPLDRQASTVRDGIGEGYTPAKKIVCEHWDAPPPQEDPMPPNTPDMTGRRFGKMTVVRYHRGRDGARWLCRCACGDYELRRARAILNPANTDDGCGYCQHTDFLRRRASGPSTMARRKVEESRLDALAQATHTPKA